MTESDPLRSPTGTVEPPASADPGVRRVYDYLVFGLSLPERTIRSTTAVLAGTLHESTALLLPQAFRSSRTYETFVQQMLDFLARDIGGVEAAKTPEGEKQQIENFVARKTVGNFVEMAGLATLHLSPLTVLALVSDIAYGSGAYLRELSDELKREGIISHETTIDHASDLLEALSRASGVTAQAFDTPPLSLDGLKQTIDQTRAALAEVDPTRVLPEAELARMWNEMHEIARREKVSLLEVSSTLTLHTIERIGTVGRGALSGVRVAGNLFDRHILDHYAQGLKRIQQQGLYPTLAETSRPYITAVWKNFSNARTTWTEWLLRGLWIRPCWRWLCRRGGRHPGESPSKN